MRGTIAPFLLCCLLQVGCTCGKERPSEDFPSPGAPDPSGAAPTSNAKESALPKVETLLALPQSAYGNRLYTDGEGFLLLTGSEVIRVSPPSEVHRTPASFGPEAVRLGQHQILFFRDGSLRRATLSGKEEATVAKLPSAPYLLLSSGDSFAWVLRTDSGYLVQTLESDRILTVHETTRRIGAATLWADRVYLLESFEGSWRVVGASLHNHPAYRQEIHQGRPPSMLMATENGVYLYAGLKDGIKRLSLDLQATQVLATNVTCSPFAISNRLVCAQVGGLIQITGNKEPRIVALERGGPITAIAATNQGTAWLVDTGKERLQLKFSPLPPLPDDAAPP